MLHLRMISRFTLLFLVLAVVVTTGCAKAPPRQERGDPYLILAADLEKSGAQNVYDAISHLRPFWLSREVRGRTGESTISVYLDERLLGTLSVLQHISVSGTGRVQYMRPTEAQTRFGQINGGRAAILIQTIKPRP